MTDLAVVWLGVIAVSIAIIAAVQIFLIVVGLRLTRQLSVTADEIRREIRPLVEKVHRIADDAAKVTSLAAVQVERIDQLLSTTALRVDDALNILRNAMGGPLRQGYAVALAVRAAFDAFRRPRSRDRRRRDEDDALFVG